MSKIITDINELLNHIKLAWINGVSFDYKNGLIWSGEFATSVSLSFHLRRMYLDYHPLLRMWFEITYSDVGQIDITISETLPDFKGHDYAHVTYIDRRDLIAIEMKYATGSGGVKGDIRKLETLVKQTGFKNIVPLVAYIDCSGDTEDDAPSLEDILSRLSDSPVGLLYGHPYKREAWSCHNLPAML